MTALATSPLRTLRIIAADIKIAHSVFAMPFALLAAFMAAVPPLGFVCGFATPITPSQQVRDVNLPGKLGLIVVAMILARTVAMLTNRLLDSRIDKDNPRTSGRAIPNGQLTVQTVLLAVISCSLGFLLVSTGFGYFYQNWWPLWLSTPLLLWVGVYPLFKRFTWTCHIYLGSSLALSPLAAALAIDPIALRLQTSLFFLSGMVLCWVAGFDIIYALQDVEIDRAQNLHSIPARLGITNALWISRGLHALSVACLVACLLIDPRFHILFGVSVIIVAALLIYEHLTVARWGTTRIALAFFTLNGIISCVLGALGILDVFM